MRVLFTFIFLTLFAAALSAQVVLQRDNNLPRENDIIHKQIVSYISPGEKGRNVFWDFSKLNPSDNKYVLTYKRDVEETLIGIEHNTMYKYEYRRDSLFLCGFENPTTRFIYKIPQLIWISPFVYGQQITNYSYGEGIYCENYEFYKAEKSTLAMDATGSLLFSDSDTIHNVFRLHTHTEIIEDLYSKEKLANESKSLITLDSLFVNYPTDSTLLVMDSYRWYKVGYRYPIFEVIESVNRTNGKEISCYRTAFYYPMNEQYYTLDIDPENENMRNIFAYDNQTDIDKEKSELNSKSPTLHYKYVFDHSANEILVNYTLSTASDVEILLFDPEGRQLWASSVVFRQGGQYTESIPLNDINQSIVILRIKVNNTVYGEKIIKSKL